ncbi:endolytic transglycosylase MltG [Williamsia deligens]|uniref:Endolytic murein transglycosylase n=1 Tax=Williamsia deligens TaxID=321325 RepID=A0ABW3GC65_9NOCA|nr:endolytic transglycosylase MltG [Williamsia deligens]MCP2195337.1 UPF0755 protein [Williamsia deligens]
MSDNPNRHHRRPTDGDTADGRFLPRVEPGAHPHAHRRARPGPDDGGPPRAPRPRIPRENQAGTGRQVPVDPYAAGWTEPRRARPEVIPPAEPAGLDPRARADSPAYRDGATPRRDEQWERPLRGQQRDVSTSDAVTRSWAPVDPRVRDPRVDDTEARGARFDDTEARDRRAFAPPETDGGPTAPPLDRTVDDRDRRGAGDRPRRRGGAATARTRRRRRRVALAGVLVVMVALVCGLGYAGLRLTGFFVDDEDFSGSGGRGDVLVQIPDDASLTQFGQILTDQGVVGSVRAFTDAADGKPISAGFYKLRTHISASSAVSMLDGDDNRVGRLVIPAGRQLDTKQSSDGSATTGIFAMLSQATTVTIDGKRRGVTAEQLAQAAATASPADLGVPSWATDRVQQLTGDHRRIEGLIAPVAWEAIDPSLSPTAMLRYLISTSAGYFERWGLTREGSSGLDPYQTLVAASVVEKEVADPADYGKVARVIVNRLAKNQKLEMDSTANYTAAVVNIDVSGDAYTADTKWNTYRVTGLPATPIGSVGENVVAPTVDPPAGNWLYFVAVDAQGTTVFTDDYQQHLRNRQRACDNKVLSVGCQ